MRIVQITDTHIGQPGALIRGVDVCANYKQTLTRILKYDPDIVVHTGDLCAEKGEESIYRWINEVNKDILGDIPFYCIPGNHDNSEIQAVAFNITQDLHSEECFFSLKKDTDHIVFMDTSKGTVSQNQLSWLDAQVGKNKRRCIIFMHHPPCFSDVPYMDANYALKNMDAVMEVFQKQSEIPVLVFCGHYHVELTVVLKNVQVHITPSTFFQIDATHEDFAVDHYRCGFRVIDWSEEALYTSVHYVD